MKTLLSCLTTLSLLTMLLVPPAAFADESHRPGGTPSRELRLEHLGTGEGLSSSSVSGIIQDRQGFIWIATQSGLNRYDGYSINLYEHDPFDRNSLSHNLIQTMWYEESSGALWLGTYGGLNRFDPDTETFRWYRHKPEAPGTLSNNVVVDVIRDARGQLWVGTLKGLNRFDEETGRFIRYMQGDPAEGELPNDVIRSLAVDREGTLWAGTYGGLCRYVPERDGFITFADAAGSGDALPSPYVMTIVPDPEKRGVLWLGTWNGGVSRVNTRTGAVRTYSLPHNEVYTIMFDSRGMLWVGTWGNGPYLLDPGTGQTVAVHSISPNPAEKISDEVIYSFMEDESGILWIGTNGGAVYKYVPWENRFTSFVHDPKDPATISDEEITAMHFDPDGTGWFGTYDGGLNRYDPSNETFYHYKHTEDDPASLSNDIVNDIFRDSRGKLWIGTNEGLNRYLPESDSFERIYAGSGQYTPPEDVVFEIAEGPEGALWLGTNTSGVAVYDYAAGSYEVLSHDPHDPHSLSDNLVRAILHDSSGTTWVGTNDGLNRYNRSTGTFTRYYHDIDDPGSISGNNIREIHEDSKGRIWIATMGGGVSRYERESNSFSHLTTKDGLASNQVLGILEDENGTLWFPTNRGVSIYDPVKKSFRTINEANGLISNELTKASAQGPEGNFYLGSIKGVTVITGTESGINGYVPPLVFTTFTVLGEKRDLQRAGPHRYEPIVLDHTESFFSFEFAVLDYASPEQNSYSYRLEGFDGEWKPSTGRNFVSYTNLDPGSYTLSVKGAGSRGNWNERGISVPIEVLPPWWHSNYAYGGYALLTALLLLFIFLRVHRRRLQAEARIAEKERINRELDTKVRERTAEIERSRALAEEATRAKTLFLANMSHEIRTPLNGLVGMLSLLEKTSLQKEQQEYVHYSRISAENLSTLVNDLLDFERIEAGELKLSADQFSLRETADYVERLFSPACGEKGLYLDIRVELGGSSDRVVGDRNRVVQLLTNLVSNAVKYTRQGGILLRIAGPDSSAESSLDATAASGRLQSSSRAQGGQAGEMQQYLFEVRDTGVGIAPEDLDSIFETFKQLDNGYTKTARGVGLGLAIVKQVTDAMNGSVTVESEPGKGTSFRVLLPLGPAGTGQPASAFEPEPAPAADGRSPAASETETQAAQPAASEAETHTTRILVCEDEGINRLYIVNFLRKLGYSIDIAVDGAEAVEKAAEGSYSLILMDLGMPTMSGLEAARRIRSREREQKREPLPIIALTAHTYDEDISKCKAAGMNDFVSKPIQEARLLDTIRRWSEVLED